MISNLHHSYVLNTHLPSKCLLTGTGDRVLQASTSVTRAVKQDNKVSLFRVFSRWIRQYELGLRAYLHSWYA